MNSQDRVEKDIVTNFQHGTIGWSGIPDGTSSRIDVFKQKEEDLLCFSTVLNAPNRTESASRSF